MIWGVLIVVFFGAFVLGYYAMSKILDYFIERSESKGLYVGPWKTHLGVGGASTSRIEKAAIARIGLGGNSAEETIYWNVFRDSSGKYLNTSNTYEVVLHEPLPVNYEGHGFWSITAYGEDQFLMNTGLDRYMVRSNSLTDFQYPLRITLSFDQMNFSNEPLIPLSEKKQRFTLALRCYRQQQIMKEPSGIQKLKLPEINRIE